MDPFLKLIESLSVDNKARGTQFEGLCKWFLENDPRYSAKLEQVWLWEDWPDRWGPDCGIDLIAQDTEDNVWAIQAKCYNPDYSVTKKDIDSFLSESTNNQIHNRLLIATTDRLGAKAVSVIKRQNESVPVNQLMLSGLLEAPIVWPQSIDELSTGHVKEKYSPKPYQRIAINKVTSQLDHRGQLIMACGTGKTLTALWIAEELKSHTILVLLPSLLLLSKTLAEWLTHCNEAFAYLPVCSDDTVTRGSDAINLSTSELAFPSTTDAEEIATFLNGSGRKVIFSTYQSSGKIADAFRAKEIEPFDLIIADEAHRCAGKASSGYGIVLDDKNIPADKRLFMTATPKLFQAHFKKRAEDAGVQVISMDDEAVFGPVLHKLSFGEAIEQDLLSDYQVVIVGIDNPTYEHMISERTLVETDNQIQSDAQSLASHIALAKAMQNYDLRRVISFHSRVNAASDFASNLTDVIEWMPLESRPSGEVTAKYVSGQMPTSRRTQRLQALGEVQEDQRYVLSNARCLSEGVDVPTLDGVAFIDPRNSEIDIVQAVGRAIRLSKEKDVGTIVIPVFINDEDDTEEVLNSSPFKKVWAVVNALRSHDELLGAQLDQLRTELGKRGTVGKPDKIIFDLPTKITRQFEKALETKLLEATTASWEFWFGLLEVYRQGRGDCEVPALFKTEDGYNLGRWVVHQREIKNHLATEKVERLDNLGFVWDMITMQWERGYDALNDYRQKFGDCLVNSNYKTEQGFKLGGWVNGLRTRKKNLSVEKIKRLDDLGFVWNVIAAQWESGFDALKDYNQQHGDCLVPDDHQTENGFNLGKWVGAQRTKKDKLKIDRVDRLDNLGFVWDVIATQWERGFNALCEYKQEYGDTKVLNTHIAVDRFKLGVWVSTQRANKNKLPKEMVERLDNLSFLWDPRSSGWEKSFDELKNYKRENGDCLVNGSFKTKRGFKLGQWVVSQRSKMSKLSAERVKRLDDLGFVWDPLSVQWEYGYEALKEYKQKNGHLFIPHKYKTEDGFSLGGWVNRVRVKKGDLPREKVKRLNDLLFVWDPLSAQWERGFDALRAYKLENGDCKVPASYKSEDGFSLGNWVSTQRRRKNSLQVEKIKRLDDLGFVWDVLAMQWEQGFAALEDYKDHSGDCLVPAKQQTVSGFRLGGWVEKQRTSKNRLPADKVKRLDDLGFVWDPLSAQWERGFDALRAYKLENGDCKVPASYKSEDGFSLGSWVRRQMYNKSKLSVKRISRLNDLGLVWRGK